MSNPVALDYLGHNVTVYEFKFSNIIVQNLCKVILKMKRRS